MKPSIHDNRLISYSVCERDRRIELQTYFDEVVPNELTNVTFTNLVAYFFENHSISLGTILFGIDEIDPNSIVNDNWQLFEAGKPYLWPGPWGASKEKAAAFFEENKIKGFVIIASSGLCGWVLAESMQLSSVE